MAKRDPESLSVTWGYESTTGAELHPLWATGLPLTCFITYLTWVFVSSTTRFTPKAPGLSSCKIYQQAKEKLSGNAHIPLCTSTCIPSSTTAPTNFCGAGRASISSPLCSRGNGPGKLRSSPMESDPISLQPILAHFLQLQPAGTTTRHPKASYLGQRGLSLDHYDLNFQDLPQSKHPSKKGTDGGL